MNTILEDIDALKAQRDCYFASREAYRAERDALKSPLAAAKAVLEACRPSIKARIVEMECSRNVYDTGPMEQLLGRIQAVLEDK